MAGLFNLAKFFPSGRGRLSRIEEMLDRHSRILENIEAEDRATVRPNARGGFTISASGSRGSGGAGIWSGIVWYLGELTLDFSKVGNDPEGEDREFGMYGVQTVESEGGPVRTYQGSVTGCYLKIEMVSGEATFTDAIDDDVDEYNYYPVAQVIDQDDEENNIYSPLSGRTVGDVRVDSVPYHEPIEEEEEI